MFKVLVIIRKKGEEENLSYNFNFSTSFHNVTLYHENTVYQNKCFSKYCDMRYATITCPFYIPIVSPRLKTSWEKDPSKSSGVSEETSTMSQMLNTNTDSMKAKRKPALSVVMCPELRKSYCWTTFYFIHDLQWICYTLYLRSFSPSSSQTIYFSVFVPHIKGNSLVPTTVCVWVCEWERERDKKDSLWGGYIVCSDVSEIYSRVEQDLEHNGCGCKERGQILQRRGVLMCEATALAWMSFSQLVCAVWIAERFFPISGCFHGEDVHCG